jgi:hypothetical protein
MSKILLPLTNRKAKLSMIHIAKKDTGIADDAYRIILDSAAGVDSAAKLEFEWQFNAIMKAFENLGFKSTQRNGKKAKRPQWTDEWGGTEDQRAKIEVMWQTCARNKSEKALRAFIKRIARVDHPRFLRVDLARKVILALEKMMQKAGYDPATGKRIA